MSSVEYDVVIVGAGLSGLSAAYEITKKKPEAKIIILEATDYIGGPIKTVKMKGANGDDYWDVGASRIGSKQVEIMNLIGELGLETYEHYDEGKKYWQLPNGSIKSYSGKIPPLPYTSLVDVLRYFNKVDGMQGKVNLEDAKATPKADEWDNMTVDELKTKTLWTQVAKDMVDVLTIMFFGIPPTYLSVMQYAYVIATCGSWNAHIAGDRACKLNLRIKGGTRGLVDRLIEKIGKDKFALNAKVSKINQDGGPNSGATVETEAGKQYTAKKVIVAVPVMCNASIKFTPALGSNHLLPSAIAGLFFVITYKKSFWREQGSCADTLNMQGTLEAVQEKTEHPILVVFDHTSANGNPALMGAFGALSLREKTSEERRGMVVKYLREVFQSDEPTDFVDYQDYSWSPCKEIPPEDAFKEERASYVLSSIRKPEGAIHWAGSHTATAWYDCLSGAVQAGQRAGKEVI
ncbi:amine oxidase [flavin-containing] A-like isoform X1 [Apostichopus japonicus]|uniref:amine oxidase [flavin-containing] A-like isoform X1 n=2 Tax=Stichopus japonicus TaxID=307972 RepID=UPI003AB14548